MRILFLSAALAATALTAAPALAQYQGGRGDDRYEDRRGRDWDDRDDDRNHRDWNRHGVSRQAIRNLLRELDEVELRIARADRNGSISEREAFGLRREANRIRARLHQAARNGLSGREYGELRSRVSHLQQRLRFERRDRDGRRW